MAASQTSWPRESKGARPRQRARQHEHREMSDQPKREQHPGPVDGCLRTNGKIGGRYRGYNKKEKTVFIYYPIAQRAAVRIYPPSPRDQYINVGVVLFAKGSVFYIWASPGLPRRPNRASETPLGKTSYGSQLPPPRVPLRDLRLLRHGLHHGLQPRACSEDGWRYLRAVRAVEKPPHQHVAREVRTATRTGVPEDSVCVSKCSGQWSAEWAGTWRALALRRTARCYARAASRAGRSARAGSHC